MWIIKIGGSLQDSDCLHAWLQAVARHGAGRLVLVPGGGRHADAIRQAQRRFGFDDHEAHVRAIEAMETHAAELVGRQPGLQPASGEDAIRHTLQAGEVPVWLPAHMALGLSGLPASWDVSSDSLALWLARHLGATGLIMVKSITVEADIPVAELSRAGIIDRYFPLLYQRQAVPLVWCAREQYGRLAEILDRP